MAPQTDYISRSTVRPPSGNDLPVDDDEKGDAFCVCVVPVLMVHAAPVDVLVWRNECSCHLYTYVIYSVYTCQVHWLSI